MRIEQKYDAIPDQLPCVSQLSRSGGRRRRPRSERSFAVLEITDAGGVNLSVEPRGLRLTIGGIFSPAARFFGACSVQTWRTVRLR